MFLRPHPLALQLAYSEAVQKALTKLQGHVLRASAAAAPAAQPAASVSEQSATSRPSGPHAVSAGAATKLPHGTQQRVAPPAAASPARSEDYWQFLYALRDKYTPLLQATKVTVSRISSAAGATGENRVIRTLDEELLPLLRSTPASPAPAFRTLADLVAAERTMVTLINRVVLAARQQQQARAQQASSAPAGQQASAAAGAPAPVKRRTDAAFPELSPAAKRRQARAARVIRACEPLTPFAFARQLDLAAACAAPSAAIVEAVAAVPGARLVDNRALMGALLAAGAPPGALVVCEAGGVPPLPALLPADYPDSPPLAVFDGCTPRYLGGPAIAARAALAGGAPAASLAQLAAAWHAAARSVAGR
jgi:hypothetical protein